MLKKLKSLFIVEDENQPNTQETVAEPEEKKPAAKEKSTMPATTTRSPQKGKPSDKFLEILFKAMEKYNAEGFDYLEFKQSLKSLEKMPMDESTRYQSAFAMAQTMGATPENLLKTAQHYLDVLSKEETKFEEALNAQKEKQVGQKQKKLVEITKLIKKKEEEITKLQNSISQHEAETKSLEESIEGAAVKMELTKSNFIATYNALVGKINADIQNMKKHLK